MDETAARAAHGRVYLAGGIWLPLVFAALALACVGAELGVHPDHEIGLLALGVGLLVAHATERARYFIAAVLVIPVTAANVLWQYGVVPGSLLEGVHVVGLGAGLALVTLAARRGYIGANPVTLALLLGGIGLLLVGVGLPSPALERFYAFFESLWMPAVVFGALSVVEAVRGRASRAIR